MAKMPEMTLKLDVAPELAHIDQYFGVYAMHEESLHAIMQQVRQMDLNAHIVEMRERSDMGPAIGAYRVQDGVAVIDLKGTMTKYGSSLSQMQYGTIGVRKALRDAVRNDEVKSILLLVESPGGTAQGTQDLADEVARANEQKPVTAYIEDMGASAAYWVASQAGRVVSNSSAMVGSIGTYGVVYDYSEMARMDGVKVHVLRAGQFKGRDIPGQEIQADALADFQRVVNEINDLFVAGVAKGRRVSDEKVRAIADGRIHIASRALELNLIDEIGSFDTALKSLAVVNKGRSKIGAASTLKELKTMSDQETVSAGQPTKPQPATFADIKACCPGATSDFICSQLERNVTLDQAQSNWMEHQNKLITESRAAVEEAEKKLAAKAEAEALGVPALGNGGAKPQEQSGDPLAEWPALLAKHEARGLSKQRALSAAVKENPELHRAYVEAHNAEHGRVVQFRK